MFPSFLGSRALTCSLPGSMSKEIRNGLPLSLHCLLFGKAIGGMRWGGGTVERQEEGRATVLRQIRSLFQVGAFGDLTDGQLLERFMTGHKESAEMAFTALVERHGLMVRRVCRRALTDSHQAQHAFQATFPVLVQQAGSVRHKDSAASWLYGVAYRVASYARSAESRRRKHEALHSVRQEQVSPTNQYESAELARLLDEELCRLPERFRAPIVLCDLEDVTHEQAAGRLTLSRAGPKKCLRKPLKRLPAPFRRPLERFEVVDDVVRPDLAPGQSALDAVSFGQPFQLAAREQRRGRGQRPSRESEFFDCAQKIFGAVVFRLQGVLSGTGDQEPSALQARDRRGDRRQSVSRTFMRSDLPAQAVKLPERSFDHEGAEETTSRLQHRCQATKQRIERLHPLERRATADKIIHRPGLVIPDITDVPMNAFVGCDRPPGLLNHGGRDVDCVNSRTRQKLQQITREKPGPTAQLQNAFGLDRTAEVLQKLPGNSPLKFSPGMIDGGGPGKMEHR